MDATPEPQISSLNDIDKVLALYSSMVEDNQKKQAAYYLESIIKQLVSGGKNQIAASIIFENLIGEKSGLNKKAIQHNYLSKVSSKSNKPRLMFCSGPWLTGGMERVLSNLFKNLHNIYDLYLITPFDGEQGLIELPGYVTHIKLSREIFSNSFDVVALTHSLILDIDVVIGFWNLCHEQLDFYKLCAGTRIKTVAANNEMYFYPYGYPFHYELIQKRLDVFGDVDAVTWPTNFSAAAYGLVHPNSFWMPNPNTYKVQKTDDINNEKIILCVGRFNDYIKRVDRMIECFSIVSKNYPSAKLILVGKYDREIPINPYAADNSSINDLIAKLKVDESKIQFVGEVANVEDYYRRASVLLLTSNNEGFGMVINEAACYGIPTVANKIPGLEDLIIDGSNGYLTDQDDIRVMANRVEAILSDNILRDRMSKNAKKHVSQFDVIEVRKRWDFLIRTLIENIPKEKKLKKLNKHLSYEVSDYRLFSKYIFNEINKVISVNIEKNSYVSNLSDRKRSVKSYSLRLSKSIRKRGVLKTSKMAANLIKRKIRH